jgi:hypothetical protein
MAVSAFFVCFPITDADLFWHLAAGREMVANRHFLYADPFSFTLPAPRWIDLHWLFQLLCYGLYRAGGLKALLVMKLVAIAATTAAVCLTHRSKCAVMLSAFLCPVLIFFMRYLLDARPILITLFFMAIYVLLLESARRTGKKISLLLCILLQILWTNSQGLYMIGLLIIGAYWLESLIEWRKKKQDCPVFVTALFIGCTASCLINPYGFAGLVLPFDLLSRITPGLRNLYSQTISENVPLLSVQGYETIYRTVTIIVIMVACLLFILNRKKFRLCHLLLFAGFGWLAFAAERNVPLFFIIAIPIVGSNAADLLQADILKKIPAGNRRLVSGEVIALGCLVIGALLVREATIIEHYPPHRVVSPFRFPERITDELKKNPVPGNLFNDLRYGGYLIWNLYPAKKVFADTRLIIRSPQFFAEYLAISAHPELFDGVAQKFNITQVILPSALYTLHLNLIRWLYASRSWRLAYTDGSSVLFLRSDVAGPSSINLSDSATVHAIADSVAREWGNAPAVRTEALGYFYALRDSLAGWRR